MQRQRRGRASCLRDRGVDGDVAQRTTRTSGGNGDVVAASKRRGNRRCQNRGVAGTGREIRRGIRVPTRGAADDDVVRIEQPFTRKARRRRCIGHDTGHVQPMAGGFNVPAVTAAGAALGEQRAIHARCGIRVVHV